ncbi:MAG: PAS domain-containing sensor histidine kinase [Alphaproteobacteria bacterium]|nr:PAS domain-containing sensor histidine kinase [Alphaproteobacteria bacterium]
MTAETRPAAEHVRATFLRRAGGWIARIAVGRTVALALAILSVASGIATYIVMTQSAPFGPDPVTVLILVNVDLALLLMLGAVVARRIVGLWGARRRGSAGSRLHVRLVVLFSLIAVTPAIVVAVFSVIFFNVGIQSWFSDQVRTALRASLAVSEAYLNEQQQAIRADILVMGQDIAREQSLVFQDPVLLNRVLSAHGALRGVPEVMLFEGSTGQVLGRSSLSYTLEFDPVPTWAIERARAGEVALIVNEKGDRVRALMRLGDQPDTFLYVGRFVDPGVLNHVKRTQDAVLVYEQLEGRRSSMQLNFALLFAVLALLLLFASVWIGLVFANQLARPISNLIGATERVRAGDMGVRVPVADGDDEMGVLGRAFNRMTSQLESQQRELLDANQQLDTRRRFTEAVLGGVSSGVIGLDDEFRINLPNRTASALLSTDLDREIGKPLAAVVPEMGELLDEALRRPRGLIQSQIRVAREKRNPTLLVRVAVERAADQKVLGYVVTFDDITELLSAQRKAAWADVARRIAHEIKNPLTPIQLSAERLKRKYLKEITSDPETFEICTDTIVRQVGDIGRMVDEFSSFARMPAPVMREEDAVKLCRQAMFLQQNGNPSIVYTIEGPEVAPFVCDGRQVGQALTNLLQNAADSILARPAPDDGVLPEGRIVLRLVANGGEVGIDIEDNGIGLPVEQRDELTEPYVTTRAKGTGLGLAIVRKIMEDHGGELVLEDRDGGGARVRLVFPASAAVAPRAEAAGQSRT